MRGSVAVLLVATALKLLLLPAYRSTDFEVHRNWLAITSSLPLSRWYVEATSEWTLDYPPLFAWFEWLLSLGAPFFDRGMLVISATPYATFGTVLYQRLTVVVFDLLLLAGSVALASSAPKVSKNDAVAAVALTFLNAGLLLVDHVHFQYNGMLIGLLLLSCACLGSGRELLAALVFALLLNLKHLFLFAAPLFFVQLLQHHVLRQQAPTIAALGRLTLLGSLVLAVFALSAGPFVALGQIRQLGVRLFPFGRGLTHAYWAPNAWALYTFTDRVGAALASRVLPRLGIDPRAVGVGTAAGAGGSSGLVGETSMLLLPNVGALATAGLVLLAQTPVLIGTWRRPRLAAFAPAVAYCGIAAYAFGYHVHEKALLPPLLILTSLSPPPRGSAASRVHARLLILFSSAGHYALLPLLHAPAEWAVARLVPIAYLCALMLVLRARLGVSSVELRVWETGYLVGFMPLDTFCSFVHPLLLAPRMAFLPLMITSVYCALGVMYCGALSYQLWQLLRD